MDICDIINYISYAPFLFTFMPCRATKKIKCGAMGSRRSKATAVTAYACGHCRIWCVWKCGTHRAVLPFPLDFVGLNRHAS